MVSDYFKPRVALEREFPRDSTDDRLDLCIEFMEEHDLGETFAQWLVFARESRERSIRERERDRT